MEDRFPAMSRLFLCLDRSREVGLDPAVAPKTVSPIVSGELSGSYVMFTLSKIELVKLTLSSFSADFMVLGRHSNSGLWRGEVKVFGGGGRGKLHSRALGIIAPVNNTSIYDRKTIKYGGKSASLLGQLGSLLKERQF